MIWIDYVMIGLVSIGVITGYLRGFNLEVYALLFWLIATVIGLFFSGEFLGVLKITINPSFATLVIAFALLFVMTLVAGVFIRLLLGAAVQKTRLNFFDRAGGMLLGAVHGLLMIVILTLLAGLTALPKDMWWQESRYLPPFQHCAVWLRSHISSALTDQIHYR